METSEDLESVEGLIAPEDCNSDDFFDMQFKSHAKPTRPKIIMPKAKDKDEEATEFMLEKRPLMKPYTYVKVPQGTKVTSVKRNKGGDLVSRTLIGTEEDFKQVEASRFLAKLNGITGITLQKQYPGTQPPSKSTQY